ncbi:MAG TPA: hypothetical protein VLX68_05870 [Chitinivibrionales bacterium]|nr:hypothetical protein [Chitinivibrionales bacterium]
MSLEIKRTMKITINGREYHSLDEVLEQFKHLINDGLKSGLEKAAEGDAAVAGEFLGSDVCSCLQRIRRFGAAILIVNI